MEEQDQITRPVIEQPVEVKKPKPILNYVLLWGLGILGVLGVLCAGIVIGQKRALPKAELTSTLTITPEPTPTPDPTAGWETVSDGQVGVTFKYPSSLLPFTNKPIVSPDLAQLNFQAFSSQEKRDHRTLTEADLQLELIVFNPARGSLEPYLSAIKTVNNAVIAQPFPGITGSYIKVKTLEGERTQTAVFYAEPEREYSEYDAIVMGENNKVATIRLMTGSHNKREQLLPILEQILSTFKFLDQTSSTENWKTYQSPNSPYTFKYPPEATLKEENMIILTQLGPTQKEATELYDGFTLQFSLPLVLPDNNLSRYVDGEIEKSKENADIVKSKEKITLNGYEGYTYTVRGLGTVKYIYLQSGKNNVKILYLVGDPAKKGFQQTIDQILSSFKFIE
ncbi:MAG TPA: hypothetical protein VMW04_04695 [Patescibacteria group bacterium]|nr:hypothetical protein [Patescibacteria group bacterium]